MKEKDIIIIVIASKNDIYDKTVQFYWNPMIEYCSKNYPNIQNRGAFFLIYFLLDYYIPVSGSELFYNKWYYK